MAFGSEVFVSCLSRGMPLASSLLYMSTLYSSCRLYSGEEATATGAGDHNGAHLRLSQDAKHALTVSGRARGTVVSTAVRSALTALCILVFRR